MSGPFATRATGAPRGTTDAASSADAALGGAADLGHHRLDHLEERRPHRGVVEVAQQDVRVEALLRLDHVGIAYSWSSTDCQRFSMRKGWWRRSPSPETNSSGVLDAIPIGVGSHSIRRITGTHASPSADLGDQVSLSSCWSDHAKIRPSTRTSASFPCSRTSSVNAARSTR